MQQYTKIKKYWRKHTSGLFSNKIKVLPFYLLICLFIELKEQNCIPKMLKILLFHILCSINLHNVGINGYTTKKHV